MTNEPAEPAPGEEPGASAAFAAASAQTPPTLAEDLLLLLFQPGSGMRAGTGTIAGEGTLFYVLAGAVATELALGGHVRPEAGDMLRKPVLDRIVARGDIRRTSRKALGLFETTVRKRSGLSRFDLVDARGADFFEVSD